MRFDYEGVSFPENISFDPLPRKVSPLKVFIINSNTRESYYFNKYSITDGENVYSMEADDNSRNRFVVGSK